MSDFWPMQITVENGYRLLIITCISDARKLVFSAQVKKKRTNLVIHFWESLLHFIILWLLYKQLNFDKRFLKQYFKSFWQCMSAITRTPRGHRVDSELIFVDYVYPRLHFYYNWVWYIWKHLDVNNMPALMYMYMLH